MKTTLRRCIAPVLFAAAKAASLVAAASQPQNLGDLSIEQLMDESVSSVSKKETRLFDSPAAVAVVTADDIRRLGIMSLPEALRLVPGMDVARITANEWAVSARGFNGEFANKLLVLVDGRTIYTPASAGVFWNGHDVPFEDIDRIEVIRGPGATLWGANAVNGVINVTTKSAKDTQGGLIATAFGTEAWPSTTVRFGGSLATDLYYRVYAKYSNLAGLVDPTGRATPDDWHTLRGGFRADWTPATGNALTVEGEYYRGSAGKRITRITLSPPDNQPADVIEHNRGGHVLGRWTRTVSAVSELSAQVYYDHVAQGDGFGLEFRDTGDFDLQHRFAVGAHEIVWGAGYRYASVDNTPSFNLTWTPRRHHLHLVNLFAQDEIAVVPGRLHFTVGSKLEHNNLVGSELQPTVRLLWTPSAQHSLWAAVSRASRTPSLFERSARLNAAAVPTAPGGPSLLVSQFGNPDVTAEKLVAAEIGWRVEPAKQWSLDLAGFFNRYDDLIEFVGEPVRFEPSPAPPHLLAPGTEQNFLTGETYGAELSVQWQVTSRWRCTGSYTWLHMRLRPDPSSEADSPQHQFQVRSLLDLSDRWELNGAVYYANDIAPPAGPARANIPGYFRFDLGIAWRPTGTLEIGLWGQNLTDSRHPEFASLGSPLLTQVPREIMGRVIWHF